MEKEEEYIKELDLIFKKFKNDLNDDAENLHWESDNVIIKALEELGMNKLTGKYEELRKYFWYA